MSRARRWTAALAAVLALGLGGAVAAQDSLSLTPGQMRGLAQAALDAGDLAGAEAFARALLTRDPDDTLALSVLAQLALAADQPQEARHLAGRLFRAAEPGVQRFQAARLAALAAARGQDWLLATFWLRRALIHAPDAQAEALVAEEARQVRTTSPVSLSLSFGAAPSDNVNGGSKDEFNVIDGFPFVGALSPDARALSGWAGTLDARLTFRLDESQTHRSTAFLRLNGRGVLLSQEALAFIDAETDADDPEISNDDFASGLIEGGLTHLFRLPRGSGQVDLTLGKGFSGEEDSYVYLRLSGLRRWLLENGQGIDLQASAERRPADDDGLLENRYGLNATWTAPVAQAGRLSLSAGLSMNSTEAINNANTGWVVSAGFTPRARVGPAEISLSAGYQFTDYPDYTVIFPVPGGRQDARRFANLSAALPDQAWAGFVPVVTLTWEDVDSNVSRFERSGFGLDLALRSSF